MKRITLMLMLAVMFVVAMTVRRLKKVNIEALLIASGQNVKRMLAFGGRGPKKLAQATALRPPAATGYETSRARKHRSNRSWWPTKAFFNSLDRS